MVKKPQRRKPTHKPDDQAQSRLFIAKARELGADRETEGDLLIDRLAQKKPEPRTQKDDK
jgi:hypothetical protein